MKNQPLTTEKIAGTMTASNGATIVFRTDAYAGVSPEILQLRRQLAASTARRIVRNNGGRKA
ncbi:MAG: hypothetical protein IJ418_02025 [Clostridia bacterium]|nr:hypothetical protein [Clostridia bacterium]